MSDLYFTTGKPLSFLNQAEIREWPEITLADVQLSLQEDYPGEKIQDNIAQNMLALSGGHPRLLEECLSFFDPKEGFREKNCRESLERSPFVWHLFTRFVPMEKNSFGTAKFSVKLAKKFWVTLVRALS